MYNKCTQHLIQSELCIEIIYGFYEEMKSIIYGIEISIVPVDVWS